MKMNPFQNSTIFKITPKYAKEIFNEKRPQMRLVLVHLECEFSMHNILLEIVVKVDSHRFKYSTIDELNTFGFH